MKGNYDILIVGAGTAGVYFGWQMALRGHSVCIVERSKRENVGKRLEVFHIDSIKFSEFQVPPPEETSPEFFCKFDTGLFYAPDGSCQKEVTYPFHVMSLPLFLQRMFELAEEAGVHFEFETSFESLVLKSGKIKGAEVKHQNEIWKIEAGLLVDASGINAHVRSQLPQDYGIETFEPGPNEKFYVVLRYIKWLGTDYPKIQYTKSWSFYKTWLAPSTDESRAIIGVGATGSYDHGEEVLKDFFNTIELPPYEIERFERGVTPFRRPPYSFVSDGFLCLGDAACLTKPFSGEGVTAAWKLCQIAADVVDNALKSGQLLSAEALWDINVQYYRNQGAKFAGILSTVPSAANTSKKENHYMFRKDIVFSSEDFTDMNRDFEMHLSMGKILKIVFNLISGVLTGNYSLASLKAMLKSVTISGKVRQHYENYPNTPKEFHSWMLVADTLWKQANAEMA
ncbi:NAD(P)/FAD-dependent oxidoreductase [bacterium]|nr:NAD(P)/FAD-dependent oxidoreductase [bacterium]